MVVTKLAEPVRRDWGVSPRGNSGRARLALGLAEGGSLGQWDWGSENAGMKAIFLLYYTALYRAKKQHRLKALRVLDADG